MFDLAGIINFLCSLRRALDISIAHRLKKKIRRCVHGPVHSLLVSVS